MRSFLLVTTLLAALLGALAGCDGSGPGDPPPEETFPRDALYVCNQAGATLSVISAETNEVVATLDLTEYGFSSNAKPHHVVVEPDGSAFYVSLIGADAIVKFDRAGELVGQVPFEAPGMLAVHPEKDQLYATHTMSLPNVPTTVAVVRRSDMTLIGDAPLEVPIEHPHAVGVHPEGAYAYVGSLSQNRLAAIDTETLEVAFFTQPKPLQQYVHFAFAPDGGRLYATGQTAGQVRIFDVSDPASPQLVETLDVEAGQPAGASPEPWHPVLTKDGETLYFGNKGANTVTALDTETLQAQLIEDEGLARPHGSALSPDGQYLYVSNNNEDGTVAVIDTGTNEVVELIEVGNEPAGLGTRAGA